jgi:hypothetical protein
MRQLLTPANTSKATTPPIQKQPTEEQLMKLLLEQQKLLGHDYPTIQTKIDSLKNDSLNLKLKVDKQIKKK